MSFNKVKLVLFLSAVIIIFLCTTVFAEILNRTGSIRVTRPDGVVSTVEVDQPLPLISSGSMIELLTGSAEFAPSEGFIAVTGRNSTVTVEAGDRVKVSIDPSTGGVRFAVISGGIQIITGNTATNLALGAEAEIDMDPETGAVRVESITGDIEVVTAGTVAIISSGGKAQISFDVSTSLVGITTIAGKVTVTTIDGEKIEVAKGESINVKGRPVGVIAAVPEVPAGERMEAPRPLLEEPGEPERPEGSRYLP